MANCTCNERNILGDNITNNSGRVYLLNFFGTRVKFGEKNFNDMIQILKVNGAMTF